MREEVILAHIQEERIYALLKNRLFIETVLKSPVEARGKGSLDSLFDVSNEMIGMKLPLLRPKDKIKVSKQEGFNGTPYTKEQIAEWKKVLEELNKK